MTSWFATETYEPFGPIVFLFCLFSVLTDSRLISPINPDCHILVKKRKKEEKEEETEEEEEKTRCQKRLNVCLHHTKSFNDY